MNQKRAKKIRQNFSAAKRSSTLNSYKADPSGRITRTDKCRQKFHSIHIKFKNKSIGE